MDESKYSRGKIYKLCINDMTYYGSTCQQLCQRKAVHKSLFKLYQAGGKTNYVTSFKLFEKCENPHIVLVEDYPCKRKEQLHARERWYIENNECVNKVIKMAIQSM